MPSNISIEGKLPPKVVKDGAKWLFLPAKFCLEPLCNWPQNRTRIITFISMVLCCLFSACILGNVNMIIHCGSDISVIFNGLVMIITLLETLGRRLLMQVSSQRLSKLLLIVFDEFWPSRVADEETHLEIEKKSRVLFNVWFTYTVIGIVCMTLPVIFSYIAGRKPMSTYYPYPHEESPFFEIIFVLESYVSMDLSFTTSSVDIFVFSVIFNCSAQSKLLTEYFKMKFEDVTQIEDDLERKDEPKRLIAKCIDHHNMLLESCKTLNALTKTFVLLRVVTASAAICVTAFMIPQTILQASTYFVSLMIEVFIYCYLGNEVIITSAEFSNVVFSCGWHYLNVDQNIEIQKALTLIITRSQTPITMTVGDFGYLTLEFFLKLVKFSFSMYTVLGKTLDKEKLESGILTTFSI